MNLRRRAPQPVSYCILPSHIKGRNIPDWAMLDDGVRHCFDTQTLFYDVFSGEKANAVVAVGPPLQQPMRRFMKQAKISLDGAPAQITEVSQTRRSCTLEMISTAKKPSEMVVTHPTLSFRQMIGPSLLDDYAGKQTLFTLSQDNDLDWIRDWARFHVDTQGVDAIVFFDNASSRYGAPQILDILHDIKGLDMCDVVSMPFQYGASGVTREHLRHRYLQFGVLEIARRRFLGKAKAALNMDVDELAYGPEGLTVFDQLAMQNEGFLTLEGSWRYPAPGEQVCHGSHIMRADPDNQQMYPKWCLDPQGKINGKAWRTHGIKGLPNQLAEGFGFLHCRLISNSWSYDRSDFPTNSLTVDPLAKRVLSALKSR